jgi:hypothetical protein
MKAIKEMVLRKYNDYFIALKNDSFQPELFFDAVSLAYAYLMNYHDAPRIDFELRAILMEAIEYAIYEECYTSDFRTLEELNLAVKSRYSELAAKFKEEMQLCIEEDEAVINSVFKKFYVKASEKVVKVSYDDIRQRWGIGILKEYR